MFSTLQGYFPDHHLHKSREKTNTENCRAPIASLDCMEDFQGYDNISTRSESQGFSRHSSLGAHLKYKALGKSGLRVSQLGLGTWITFNSHVTEDLAEEIITVAYNSGINLFDLSENYSGGRAEIQLGNILKKKHWRRSSYHIVTKIYWNSRGDERGLSRKHIIESVKQCIDRLQLAYVDVIIIHRCDDMCPIEEIVRAISHCIDQGWCMYWGTSKWSLVEISEAWTTCRQFHCFTPIVDEAEYHMFYRGKIELQLPDLYNKMGVGTLAWSPLSIGLLSGRMEGGMPKFTRNSLKKKYSSFNSWNEDENQTGGTIRDQGYTWLKDRPGTDDGLKNQLKLKDLGALSERLGCTLTQLFIAWGLKNENITCVLIGASSVDQLLENLSAIQVIRKLSSDVMNDIERILDNKPVRPQMISTLAHR